MKNFLSLDNLEQKSSLSINSFITASSQISGYPITNILKDDKNIWLSEEFLPQEIILNFRNIKLKEHPKQLTAIGVYCWNKYPTNPKIIEVLISKEKGSNFISLGHFDLSFKAGRQLIYLDDDNDIELEELLNNVNFDNLIIKLIIKETFGGKQTYINNLYLYDNIDTNNINPNSNANSNNNINSLNDNNDLNYINNEYMYIDEKINLNNNNININEIDDNKEKSERLIKIEKNQELNDNENKEVINDNENQIKQFEENISPNDEDNISDIKSKTMIENFNKKRMIPNRVTKTPKLFKKHSNKEDRPMTANPLNNRNFNTTVRQYNNKNILDNSNYNNNSFNNITNSQLNNGNSHNKLSQLINEFRIYKENQESIMNNYENRVRLLEEKCIELKNTMRKMNATMNTIIESQYSQSQASNEYFLKECQNMINEAIVNVISNFGRNMNPYSIPMGMNPLYPNLFMNAKKNKNMNNLNNMLFPNYNSIPLWRGNYNFMEGKNIRNREMNFNNINNNINNFYDENQNNFINDNDNDENNINDNDNENGEGEYYEQEMNNNNEEEYNNFNNIDKENNMEYFENNNNNDIINNDNENKVMENNINDDKTDKDLYSNNLYNDGLMSYEERIRTNPKKFSNLFSKSTNNYRINKNIIVNQNNNLDNINQEKLTSTTEETQNIKLKKKSQSNSNINNAINQNITETNIPKSNNVAKKDNNYENKKYLNENKSKPNIHKNIINNSKEELNKDSSSDNSIDNIQINTNITENILKPTLEKFENYISINNFGKSHNVYSFNNKKDIFGDSIKDEKAIKGKNNKNDNSFKNVKKIDDEKKI